MGKNLPDARTQLSTAYARLRTRAAMHAAGETGPMFFLLRMAFWLSIVLILLPAGTAQRGTSGSEVGASDAISAASATVSDLKGFCSRQPDACSVGSQMATELSYRAQAGAKMLYEFLTEAMAKHQSGTLTTGSTPRDATKAAMESAAAEKASQNTLTATDLAPAWRGPAVRKDAKHAA